ncbi:ABC transporter substrate-binding protein [Bacteriovorax sp. DB6_IX]|uniref:ABC transporter substrate-binding protein n=1 Tax=Bacteriovorax sp. DB6_IX TaxID=1353530 RepID=UPI00038A0BDB|nr:ABC transporter substrate binding protein [Bacteriovorax sp. DB6_IX]EQC50692.1 oligopeptide ABC transporter, oligopeptide-binding protein [Bacteriovorax sp. DB6_IX]
MKAILLIISLLLSLSCFGQKERKKIVLIRSFEINLVRSHIKHFFNSLKEQGINPSNVDIIQFNGRGNPKLIKEFVENYIIQHSPDVVVTNATLATAIARPYLREKNIPQVYFTVFDPVDAGIVADLENSKRENIAGAYLLYEGDVRGELFHEIIGKKDDRVGMIYSSYPSEISSFKSWKSFFDRHGKYSFSASMINYPGNNQLELKKLLSDFKRQVEKMKDEVDYFILPDGPLGVNPIYVRWIEKISGKPVLFATSEQSVKAGAIYYVHPDVKLHGEIAAKIVVDILKGRDIRLMPSQIPRPPVIFLNLKSAKKFGIDVPKKYLNRAKGYTLY